MTMSDRTHLVVFWGLNSEAAGRQMSTVDDGEQGKAAEHLMPNHVVQPPILPPQGQVLSNDRG